MNLPLEKETATHSSINAGEFHGQKSLAGYTVHRVTQSRTQLKRLSTHEFIQMFTKILQIFPQFPLT